MYKKKGATLLLPLTKTNQMKKLFKSIVHICV